MVIFQEHVSFDHYFATYPNAANPAGEPAFTAAPGTLSDNGLTTPLLYRNPNLDRPFRLDRSQALTRDMQHNYQHEQQADDSGVVDLFVQKTAGRASNPAQCCPTDAAGNLDAVMGYYDGNTVTAVWNYAQHFAKRDNAYNEQRLLVQRINHLESLPTWSSTAVSIAYDDSGGWYGHVMPPVVNESATPLDVNRGPQLGHARPLRLRAAPAVSGDLDLREAELRQPHTHRPELDCVLHRG
ncbi:MAG TPA: alkaline phosphatase family protein [Dehalococcoidia bacterium]|nr:alkaline phosphatase family protein [Dehalococcoidia bacterium]